MNSLAIRPSPFIDSDWNFTASGEGNEARAVEVEVFQLADLVGGLVYRPYEADPFELVIEATWEALADDWDGYGAPALGTEALLGAAEFIATLPDWLSMPRIAPAPNGSVAFEWYGGPRRRLFATVMDRKRVYWAALFGEDEAEGAGSFRFGLPKEMLSILAALEDLR